MSKLAKGAAAPILDKIDHPYYAAEGCFYKNGCHHSYGSFADFAAEYADNDKDYNLLYRFDVKHGAVFLYFMMQRKAAPYSVEFPYEKKDDAAIEAFLAPYWEHMRSLWTPFSGADVASVEASGRA